MIFVYVTILKIVKKREEYEREERLMALENNQNFFSQTVSLNHQNTQGNLRVHSNPNAQVLANNSKGKLLFGNNGFKNKNNSLKKNSNSVSDEDEATLNDRLLGDDRAKNVLFNRVSFSKIRF